MVEMKMLKINVKGMHCKSCKMLLKEAIGELPGINKVNAKIGQVEVEFDESRANEDMIKNTIVKEGYGVN